jgi:ankyrin repeat protein
MAAENNAVIVLDYLINTLNIDPNIKNSHGQSPAHLAAERGAFDIVKFLIKDKENHKSQIDIDEQDKNGRTILHLAIGYGTRPTMHFSILDIVIYLVETVQVNLNKQDNEEQTALHLALKKEFLEVVEYLVMRPEIDCKIENKDRHTALHLAIEFNFLLVVERLIENLLDNSVAFLYYAVQKGNIDVVKLLVEQEKINLGSKDINRKTLLKQASESGSCYVLKYLADNKEFKNDLQKEKNHFLKKAVQLDRVEIVKYLIEESRLELQINIKDRNGRTFLHFAALSKALDVIKYLVANRIDVNAIDKKEKRTALHLAAITDSNFEVCKYLVEEAKVKVELLDKNGFTAKELAEKEGYDYFSTTQ